MFLRVWNAYLKLAAASWSCEPWSNSVGIFLVFGPDVSVLRTQGMGFGVPGLYGHGEFGEMGTLRSLVYADFSGSY